MTKLKQVYKCNVCGNITEILTSGGGELVCCGQPMEQLVENSKDGAKEKHVPFVEKKGDSIEVQVGSVSHPMEDSHYIEWIELIADNTVYRHHLKPSEEPKASFKVNSGKFEARAYCNLHGLWKGE